MRNKFLVRDLIVYEGGAEKKLSLQYIKYEKESVFIIPYDRERAGYIYCTHLVLRKTDDRWEILELSM